MPRTSHTVLLEKPLNAQRSDSSTELNPGLAWSAGANSTHFASTVTSVTPIKPIAGAGSGSATSAAMTPEKIAK
jgi:hypothetical protein